MTINKTIFKLISLPILLLGLFGGAIGIGIGLHLANNEVIPDDGISMENKFVEKIKILETSSINSRLVLTSNSYDNKRIYKLPPDIRHVANIDDLDYQRELERIKVNLHLASIEPNCFIDTATGISQEEYPDLNLHNNLCNKDALLNLLKSAPENMMEIKSLKSFSTFQQIAYSIIYRRGLTSGEAGEFELLWDRLRTRGNALVAESNQQLVQILPSCDKMEHLPSRECFLQENYESEMAKIANGIEMFPKLFY